MKKVLVIGAAGSLGINVIKYLLSEGKYEITTLDLRNNRSYHVLKKYRKRINIINGDMNDRTLIDNLVSDHDVVYALAGVIPPLSEIKKNLSYNIEYEGIKNIVRAINAYNPKCLLIYSSSTTVYGKQTKTLSIKDKVIDAEWNLYNHTKITCEQYIYSKIKNYIIFRMPLIVGNFKNDYPIYNIKAPLEMEVITVNDAAYGLVKAIDNSKSLLKNTYNLTGGSECRTTLNDYFINILNTYGLSFRFIISRLLIPHNFYLSTYSDSEILENKLHFRSETLSSYYITLKRSKHIKKRFLNRLIAKPLIALLKCKKKRG